MWPESGRGHRWGANPLISKAFAAENLERYDLFDISAAGLEKAEGYSAKTEVDMTDPGKDSHSVDGLDLSRSSEALANSTAACRLCR